MSRSGYIDDSPGSREEQWALICYRGAVQASIRGARGQAFLRELLTTLDAMPAKRLVRGELESGGEYCALGAVAQARGIDVSTMDTEDWDALSKTFGIAKALAREIMWENDSDFAYWRDTTPEQRWETVREWVVANIAAERQPVEGRT